MTRIRNNKGGAKTNYLNHTATRDQVDLAVHSNGKSSDNRKERQRESADTAEKEQERKCQIREHTAEPRCHSSCWWWWMSMLLVSVLALATRLHKIAEPAHVCWDETHFGKMGSWYINRTFFFDVHPPLGKMLIGLAGHMTGYNGSFAFNKPGDQYGETPYIGMRVFCAVLGASIAPLSFCITWHLSASIAASFIAASLIICDTGTLTLSQYILLDPLLMCFIMAATYCLLKFHTCRYRAFSLVWWMWMLTTGVLLACAIGVKFVGLFVVLLAGYTVASELWDILGDLSVPMSKFVQHFVARALCLILLPLAVYIFFFWIHFKVLSKTGNGDGFFSSAFQSQLEGNPLYKANMPQHVAYGSVVTLKNYRTGGAYLHSHWHLYPEGMGARQQQVTTYSHKDDNNKWILKRFDHNPSPSTEPTELVVHGDLVRLEHVSTRRNLHSHREMAPLTRRHQQVTCYGENGTGDINDVFRVDIQGAVEQAPLRTVKSVFRLIHASTGCALHSHNKQLPKWGWEQLEVTCNSNIKDPKNLWNVEGVTDERLPNTSFEVYAPSFVERLVESHAVMAQGNSGLKPKDGEVTSRPWQWPINYRGQPFSGGEYRVYLLGNPVLWWSNLIMLAVYVLLYGLVALREQRGLKDHSPHVTAYKSRVQHSCGWLLLAWALHFLPFWTMHRVLYFHHYFPAFLYSCMLSGIMYEYLIERMSRLAREAYCWVCYHVLLGSLMAGITYSFWLFSPLSYGMEGSDVSNSTSSLNHLRWLDSWDL